MIALMVNSAYAAPVTSLPGGTVIPIPGVNYPGSGPQTFGPGNSITWTSTNGVGYFGYTANWGFTNNGHWDGSLGPMAGVNDMGNSMTFAFSTPVQGVGGFINYVPVEGVAPATIAVYDSQMNLIESQPLTFTTSATSVNSGFFLGFLENSPEIKYFTLSRNYIGITTLTTTNGEIPTPEFPSTVLPVTMIIGFLGAVLYIQRTREH